jgi:hypothetical protein
MQSMTDNLDKAVQEPMRTAIALLVDAFEGLAHAPEALPSMQLVTFERKGVLKKCCFGALTRHSIPAWVGCSTL